MDERFSQSNGTNVYTGCELLVKGSLESGVSLLTGYPGSPISEVFDVLQRNSELLKTNGIVAQIANNEALSVARLNGSQMAEMRAIAFMKSVGMHVASDSLAISNLAGTSGGAVVVVGDDTWSYSTQVPADSRVLARHLYMPLLEPSTWQEMKDWVKYAFEISTASNLYTCYLTTQNQADGGGNVELHPNHYPEISKIAPTEIDTSLISTDERVLLPPDTIRVEVELLSERFPTALETARHLGLNKIIYPPENGESFSNQSRHRIGFITSGFSYCYLEHALTELNISDTIPILKLGMTHPIDTDIIQEFTKNVDEIIVIEEKRPILENEIKAFLAQIYQEGKLERYVKVWGKQFPNGLTGIPVAAGLDASILIQRLIPLFAENGNVKEYASHISVDADHFSSVAELQQQVSDIKVDLPKRTPTFCPGCPHRDSSSVLLDITKQFMDPDYMKKHHDSPPVDLVFHGDIGCYSMLKYEPFPRLMHNLSAMTLGGGTGAGIDPFIINKQVVFMGDSTFFHGGMSAISDSIKNNQDLTYIILDNQTTAMTGHQPTPADELDILGNPTFAQDIEKVVQGLAGDSEITIVRVNPEDRLNYKKYLEKAFLKSGVKIIIADKECAITLHRRLRREQQAVKEKKGFLKVEKHINITHEVCEFCLECTKSTGCPALKIEDTDYGNKIAIDKSNCVTDGACARIKWACPSFEEVVITRKRPPRKQKLQQIEKTEENSQDTDKIWDETGLADLLMQIGMDGGHPLPPPPPQPFKNVWSAYAAGVGGMGIGTMSKILVVAGYLQGFDVHFCDRKGLAIRNGGVYTHVTYTNSDTKISPIIPYGKADLVMGLDILEAVRGITGESVFRVASSQRTDAVVNTAKTETIRMLIGEDSFETADLESTIQENSKTYFGLNLFDVSEQLFGTKLYANIMLLGVTFQRGVMPLELEPIRIALKQMVRRSDLQQNLNAFEIGRYLAVNERTQNTISQHITESTTESYEVTLEEKRKILSEKRSGKHIAASYVQSVEGIVEKLNLDENTNRSLAIYIYDLIQFENIEYARTYIEKVEQVHENDNDGYRATKATIKYLHKVMLIKDEVYVSHLLTSKEKFARDKIRYNVDEKNGDKIKYLHLNRPHFTVMGFDIERDIDTRNWMLHTMKRMKFLRRWLSKWHAKEREFREWYIREVIDTFSSDSDVDYDKHVQAMECVETVRGYREIRYPSMDAAKQLVEDLLSKQQTEIQTPDNN